MLFQGSEHVEYESSTGKAPPPPQPYRRKVKNQDTTDIDATVAYDKIRMAGFRAAQHRHIVSQIFESEGRSNTKDPGHDLLSDAESLILLDIVLNSPLETIEAEV